jgi:hypothetical protein
MTILQHRPLMAKGQLPQEPVLHQRVRHLRVLQLMVPGLDRRLVPIEFQKPVHSLMNKKRLERHSSAA